MNTDPGLRRSAAQLRRDAMIARVTRARWLTAAGAGALSAAVALLVSAVASGRSAAKAGEGSTTGTTGKAAPRARQTATMPPAANAAQLGLQPPGSSPQAPPTTATPQPQTQSAAPAPVSGGS